MRNVVLVLVACAVFAGSSALLAQSASDDKDSHFSLGLAVISAPRPYVDADDESIAFPVVLWQKGGFFFRGVIVGYEWFRDSKFFLDVYGRPRFEGYEEDDSDFLDGMDERESPFDIGVGFGYRWKHVLLRMETEADVSDNSDGSRSEVRVGFPFGVRNWTFLPAISAINVDDDWVNYYYGVQSSEAVTGRPAYGGESTENAEISFRAIYRRSDKWAFFGRIYGQSLGDEIKDSPIVDEDSVGGAMVGFLYTF